MFDKFIEKMKDLWDNFPLIIAGIIFGLGPIALIIYACFDDPEATLKRLSVVGIILLLVGCYFLYKKLRFVFSPKEKILVKCEELVHKYDNGLSIGSASCYNLITPNIKNCLSKKEVDGSNIEKEANMILRSVCLSTLKTGEHSFYRGEIGTMGYGSSLMSTYCESSQWLIVHGWLSQEFFDLEYAELKEIISISG